MRRKEKTLDFLGASLKVSCPNCEEEESPKTVSTTAPINADDHQLIRTRYAELHILPLHCLASLCESRCPANTLSTMLRSLPRAVTSSSSLRAASIRKPFRTPQTPASACLMDLRHQQTRGAAVHAISNPTLAGIEKRWDEMPPQEQADLWMALRDRMKNDWHDLTLQERKAGTRTF